MGDIGFPELVVILVIALLVFGPSRVPEMGRSLGRALREFRDAIRGEERPTSPEDAPHAANGVTPPKGIGRTNSGK